MIQYQLYNFRLQILLKYIKTRWQDFVANIYVFSFKYIDYENKFIFTLFNLDKENNVT